MWVLSDVREKERENRAKEKERERERQDLGNAGDCWREINERKEKAKLEF